MDRYTVKRAFNTKLRRFAVEAEITRADLEGDVLPLKARLDKGFLAKVPVAQAARPAKAEPKGAVTTRTAST